ncbi:glycosyltransferase family 2 protein [Ruegeria sp. R13_0]|uniref:glycosyltransferase n=1 Tax=Ruegeria sp. R13_0 TaxID=2821099 RepID=UPI001ADBF2FB|nr:glycosyltransferase family 2 protein [Ruegeria sp. R13_0]MBO9436767.1 glycosyltransferase family 2 protein [Ruegeria sp. R13_0]
MITIHPDHQDPTPSPPGLSIIIPANNEECFIGPCLDALLTQQGDAAQGVEVIVAANGCTDRTVPLAQGYADRFAVRGWGLTVLDIPEGGKLMALNTADEIAKGAARAYLDADVICSPPLIGQVQAALATEAAVYATGRLQVARAQSAVTRAYARLWSRLPFMKTGNAAGAGLFAVNAAGRARWGTFPDIISDDTYVRLHFAPDERVEVSAPFTWPMVEGFANLVRVRRRQDAGVAEVYRHYPALRRNAVKTSLGLRNAAALFFSVPVGFLVYTCVHLIVRLSPGGPDWTRGR